MGKPFDGAKKRADENAEETENGFSDVVFPNAGRFRLCYSGNGVTWEELEPLITVIGAELSDNRVWCARELFNQESCDLARDLAGGFNADTCFCKGKIEGFKMNNVTNEFMQLGEPNPAYPPWRLRMIEQTEQCGAQWSVQPSAPVSANNGVFTKGWATSVNSSEGFEVHNFGMRVKQEIKTWKICYCVGFSASGNDQMVCNSNSPEDFPQPAGLLTTIDVQPRLGTMTDPNFLVLPVLKFNLAILCGSGTGGCQSSAVMRYKIIPRAFECEVAGATCPADLPYYETGAGCRFTGQAVTETADGNKVYGGQVSPPNCVGPAECADLPDCADGSCTFSTTPTFKSIKIDASYQNNAMIPNIYDVCYCDSNCDNALYWFKAGVINVAPVEVRINTQISTPFTDGKPYYVSTNYYVLLQGEKTTKRPTGFSTRTSCAATGGRRLQAGLPEPCPKTREMKILRDPGGFVDKQMCLSEVQPDVITGHKLKSGNTDFTEPSQPWTDNNLQESSFNLGTGQLYGMVQGATAQRGNIRVLESGWFAICYCDEDCNEMINWAVFDRMLISGPHQGQQWSRYVDISFDIDLFGWGLGGNNRVQILSDRNSLQDCGGQPKGSNVFGPNGATQLLQGGATRGNPITEVNWLIDGTELVFQSAHELIDGDYIQLTVSQGNANTYNTFLADYHARMLSRVHEVFVSCDTPGFPLGCDPKVCERPACHKIKIPVKYTFQEFPKLASPQGILWDRSSQQSYKNVLINRPSRPSAGFIVCWSPTIPPANLAVTSAAYNAYFVGQAGTITVNEPAAMAQASLGLTTTQPMDGIIEPVAEVMVMFKTSDIATYSQVTGQMSLKIGIIPGRRNLAPDPKPPGTQAWIDTMFLRDYNHAVLGPGPLKTDIVPGLGPQGQVWDNANQAVCGQIFTELWSEDVDGFPQPDGCFYLEDNTDATKVIPTITIKFTKKNHLKRNTKYYMVFNAVVTEWLTRGFPGDGVIHVWSMDDYYTNPFGVVERGKASPAPEQNTRVPPRDAQLNLQLNQPAGGDPRFDPLEGFKIIDDSGNGNLELKTFCAAHNPLTPATTPSIDNQCKVCTTEADCGNTAAGLTWCTSPIDKACPAADFIFPLYKNAFRFSLKAVPGSMITGTQILRIFLHPLTQWNIGAACTAAWSETQNGAQLCTAPGGGACQPIQCFTEMVIGGPNNGAPAYPVNTIRLKLPNIMSPITETVKHTISVGNLPLPKYGFFPENMAAEIADKDDFKPFFWSRLKLATGGAKLWVLPRVKFAALVTDPQDGNTKPFKAEGGNRLYIKFVMGATIFARNQLGFNIRLLLPKNALTPNKGYKCTSFNGLSETPDYLHVLGDMIPSPKGRLGGRAATETAWTNVDAPEYACLMQFKQQMILYAGSVVFFEFQVDNPTDALKADDPENFFDLKIESLEFPDVKTKTPIYTLGCDSSSYNCDGYGSSVSVLGKLSEMILQPSNYGATAANYLSIFFKTEQMVGSMQMPEARVLVQAPEDFDFQLYCEVSNLEAAYYIPEAAAFAGVTFPLPLATPPICSGFVPIGASSQTYSGAQISTNGRLMATSLYGFKLKVLNKQIFISTDLNNWRIFTESAAGSGVDGAFSTIRFNQRALVGENTSFGVYPYAMPAANFQVSIEDLKPTGTGMPTNILFYPIIVQKLTSKPVRIMAPAGYEWDFEHYDFKFKAPAAGVDPSITVEGVDADLPISGVPSRPISEPKNVLTIDYMKGPWIPGLIYGFQARIRVPEIAPTRSANQFSIEFGYSGQIAADRDEAGVFPAPLVKRLINGMLSYTTNIEARDAEIIFGFRTITHIPRAGGILIRGPPNYVFQPICQPKALVGYPEFPHATTCLYKQIQETAQPEISLVAGIPGIPPSHYKFSLAVKNPPAATLMGNLGKWEIFSFSLISEQLMLDQNTDIPGYPTNKPMSKPAQLQMPPKNYSCLFRSAQELALNPNGPITNCAMIDWQFTQPYGYRSDMPGDPTEVIISFQLSENSNGRSDMIVRAPEGYIFNTECAVATASAQVFNASAVATDTVVWTEMEQNFQQLGFTPWPAQAVQENCVGTLNEAKITIKQGLMKLFIYVFRISVMRNPTLTPQHNYFGLEFRPHDVALSGQSSETFEGVKVWAFNNALLEPTTTAASFNAGCEDIPSCKPSENVVKFNLRPSNDAPTQKPEDTTVGKKQAQVGMIRVEAPEGFLIRGPPTALPGSKELVTCEVSIVTLETNTGEKNITNYLESFAEGQPRIDAQRYTIFKSNTVLCESDVTPSSRCRILLVERYLKAEFLYKVSLKVWNPEVTVSVGDPWTVRSYENRNLDKATLLDSVTLQGFPINSVVQTFAYLAPSSTNALMTVDLDFNMSFPVQVQIGDVLEIVAPVTYFFGEQGDSRCPGYTYIDGSLRLTVPKCGANSIVWHLQYESIPALTAVRFLVNVKNPPMTPVLNEFQVRHTAPNGERKSSRMVPGYQIIPELQDITVIDFPPTAPCRFDVAIIHGQPCQAVGSKIGITIMATPTKAGSLVGISGQLANGRKFDFSEAILRRGFAAAVPALYKRTMDQIVAVLDVRAGSEYTLTVEGIMNPTPTASDVFVYPADAMWTITTYSIPTGLMDPNNPALPMPGYAAPQFRQDEKLAQLGLQVLGYIQTIATGCVVTPSYYGIMGATVTMLLKTQFQWDVADVLRMTRPPGFELVDQSVVTFLNFKIGEQGLDTRRKFNASSTQNPSDYFMVLEKPVLAMQTVQFTVTSNLPSIPEPQMYWYFRTYKVLPEKDSDGDIIDDSQVPYPWLNRDIVNYGTNDGAFAGFLLVGEIPFTLTPEMKTPGAKIRLTIKFDLPAEVQAQQFLKLRVTAPADYTFDNSCLAIGSRHFSRCAGFKNEARLTTILPRLKGIGITVHLRLLNPGETPIPNMWKLDLFQDDKSDFVNQSPKVGYEIAAMSARFTGNNKLSEIATGYFTFTPLRTSPSLKVHMVFAPPAGQDYWLKCENVETLSFGNEKGSYSCQSLSRNSPLELIFVNASLKKGVSYTIGIGVSNPASAPSSGNNMWRLLLKDMDKRTFDGNERIQGLVLKSEPVRCGSLGWTESAPQKLSTISIEWRVFRDLPPGRIKAIEIQAPLGVMFSEDVSTVKIAPISLPLRIAKPIQVLGDILRINLDPGATIKKRIYNIRLEVSNPSSYPNENIWAFRAMKDIVVEFSHVFSGYYDGDESPTKVGVILGPSGDSVRRWGACRCLSLVLLFFASTAIC
jgi:hypothetical protein